MTGVPDPAGVKSFRATVPISHSARLRIDVPVNPPPSTKALAAKAATSSSAKCSLTTSGAAPADTIAGTPAWRMVAWCGPNPWFYSQASYTTLSNRGWGGMSNGIQFMQPLGGQFNFKGTSALGDGGAEDGTNQWYYQQLNEGRFTQNPQPYAHNVGMTTGIGFYTATAGFYPNSDVPPLGGDWFNTTNRTNIANYLAGVTGFMKLVGMQELHFDTELNGLGWNADGYSGDTHTEAQNRQAAFDFGQALALAAYGNAGFAAFDTAVYNYYMSDGWNSYIQVAVNGWPTDPFQAWCQEDFWMGWLDGMRQRNATGYFYALDATFYRPPTNYIAGATFASAYKLDIERARAFLSRIVKPGLGTSRAYASEALWNYVASHVRLAAFTWRGTDGTPFANATQPDDTTWTTMQSEARTRAMGPKRWEYTWAGGPNEESWYSNAGVISGGQANDDTTPISTVAPTITNLAKVANGGGSFTITCRAAHAYGVTHVQLWLGGTLLQTMSMTWNDGGGSITTNYNASYQDCTATLTGRSAGETIIVKAYSAKDDIKVSTIVL